MTRRTGDAPRVGQALSHLSEIAAAGIDAQAWPDPAEIDRQQTALRAAERVMRDGSPLTAIRATQRGPVLHGIARLSTIRRRAGPDDPYAPAYAACLTRLLDAWDRLETAASQARGWPRTGVPDAKPHG